MSALDDIKARAEAATEGPWESSIAATADGEEFATTLEQKASFLALSLNKEGSHLWLVDNGGVIPAATGDGPNAKMNAEFIAHARTDVPKLLAALEAVEAIAADLRGTDIHPDGDMFSQGWDRSAIWAGESIRNAINEALKGTA